MRRSMSCGGASKMGCCAWSIAGPPSCCIHRHSSNGKRASEYVSWHQAALFRTSYLSLPTTPHICRHSHLRDGVLQLEEVDRCRPRSGKLVEQGLCTVNEKWQSPKNREGAIPTTRHSMFVKSVQSMPRDCANRLLEERWVY
jgi:hypothetical protein